MSSLSHAIDASKNIYFRNDYLSVGISPAGSLGSTLPAPGGFPADPSTFYINTPWQGELGLYGDGINPSASDVVLPGTPIDSFTVGHDGSSFTNDILQGTVQIPTLSGSIKDKSTATQDKALWSGKTADGLKVDQTITMNPDDHYLTVKVTLTNTSASTMLDVRYLKSLDPDHSDNVTGSPATDNLIFAQSGNAHGVAAYIPTDAGAFGSTPVFLYAKDAHATASFLTGSGVLVDTNAYDNANLTGQPQGAQQVVDSGINLLFQVGDLAPGAHTTITYYYGETDALDLTVSKLGSKPTDLTSGNDTQSYAASAAKVFVDAGAGADSVTGSGFNDILSGGLGADTMLGGAGKDTMNGGQGADFLTGGAGADVLYGGVGQDRFIYLNISDSTPASSGRDTIMDFSHSEGDKIDLSAIDANINVAGNNSFTLVGGGFTGAAGQLIEVATTGGYFVEGDVNGDAVADFVLFVRAQAPLVASDFVL
jgi:Ca2+-binding RTX toxin-like protein